MSTRLSPHFTLSELTTTSLLACMALAMIVAAYMAVALVRR